MTGEEHLVTDPTVPGLTAALPVEAQVWHGDPDGVHVR